MKRFPALLILAILVVNAAGFYIYFVIQLNQIRSEMIHTLKFLPDDQLTILKLAKEEYEDSRVDEHEVKVNGKMYDIARIEVKGDTLIIAAMHDEKEDNLMALLGEIISKPLKSDQPVPSAVIQFITLSFILPYDIFNFENSCQQKDFHSHYSFSEITFLPAFLTPPPRTERFQSA
jgi:hypothetical protein